MVGFPGSILLSLTGMCYFSTHWRPPEILYPALITIMWSGPAPLLLKISEVHCPPVFPVANHLLPPRLTVALPLGARWLHHAVLPLFSGKDPGNGAKYAEAILILVPKLKTQKYRLLISLRLGSAKERCHKKNVRGPLMLSYSNKLEKV